MTVADVIGFLLIIGGGFSYWLASGRYRFVPYILLAAGVALTLYEEVESRKQRGTSWDEAGLVESVETRPGGVLSSVTSVTTDRVRIIVAGDQDYREGEPVFVKTIRHGGDLRSRELCVDRQAKDCPGIVSVSAKSEPSDERSDNPQGG